MKIGMNMLLWTGKLETSHFPLFSELKALGYDGVEIPLSPSYSDAFLQQIRQELDALDLACTCSAFLPKEASPIHPDLSIRDLALAQLKRFVDMAALLGSQMIMGPIHSPHKVFPGRGPMEDEQQRCAEILYQAAEYAKPRNIQLSIEFLNRFECYFLSNSRDAQSLVKRINHPLVGMTYDTHHAHIEDASVYQTIMEVKDAINHIHLSESHRGTPGKGLVNWAEVFQAIQDMAYEGWLVIEAFGQHNQDLILGANIWRNCFESEEELLRDAIAFVKNGQNFSS